jgi:hypothetical protein
MLSASLFGESLTCAEHASGGAIQSVPAEEATNDVGHIYN